MQPQPVLCVRVSANKNISLVAFALKRQVTIINIIHAHTHKVPNCKMFTHIHTHTLTWF
jgi:hypothetical protein